MCLQNFMVIKLAVVETYSISWPFRNIGTVGMSLILEDYIHFVLCCAPIGAGRSLGQRSQSSLTSVHGCYMMYSRLPASERRISVLYLHAVNRLDRGDSLFHCKVTVSCRVLRRKCCCCAASHQDCDSLLYQLYITPSQCDNVLHARQINTL